MKRVVTGLAALVAAHACPAWAGPEMADLWIGFPDSDNGFLLDEATGDLWMTGPCLKALERAVRVGDIWTSRTVELVSIGRGMATLDQTFELQTTSGAASVTVTSQGRGGPQSFAAIVERGCDAGSTCASLIASQTVCAE